MSRPEAQSLEGLGSAAHPGGPGRQCKKCCRCGQNGMIRLRQQTRGRASRRQVAVSSKGAGLPGLNGQGLNAAFPPRAV